MSTDMVLWFALLVAALALLSGTAALEAGIWWVIRARPQDPFAEFQESAPEVEWLRMNAVWALATIVSLKGLLVVLPVWMVSGFAVATLPREFVAVAAIALVAVIIAAQFLPYGFVLGRDERTIRPLVRLVRWLSYLLAPIALPLAAVGRRLVGARAISPAGEESRTAVGWTEEAATPDEQHEDEGRQMLRGILELEETSAREVMVPRVDMTAIDVGTPLDEAISLVISKGFSRIPLYDGTLDTVVGVIYAKDLLLALRSGTAPKDLHGLARPAYFIPETKRLGDLLREFRASRVHLAIVVDEYGGTAGLVTIEDLLEEIVGEIEDEYDIKSQDELERVSDHEALIDARMSIDDFNELFDLTLQAEDYDTVGGFVYTQLGRIPSAGDQVHINGIVVSVVSTAGRRIKRLRVDRVPHQSADALDHIAESDRSDSALA